MKFWTGILFLAVAVAVALLSHSPPAAQAHDYDCADFANQAEAQEYLLPGDPYRLDADNDGVACEDLPCPCSYSTQPEEESGGQSEGKPKPKPYRLKMRSAMRISEVLVELQVRRIPSLDSSRLINCSRLAERRIDCALSARGESVARRVICYYRVAVSAPRRHPRGRIASRRCDSTEIRHLSAPAAKAAMQATADEVIGKPGVSVDLKRLGRLTFSGEGFWIGASSTPGSAEACRLPMAAQLEGRETVRVDKGALRCETSPMPTG